MNKISALCILLLSTFCGAAGESVLKLSEPGRQTFIRNEQNPVLELQMENQSGALLANIVVSGSADGKLIPVQKVPVVKAGSRTVCAIPVETRLKPGKYPWNIAVGGIRNGRPFEEKLALTIRIAPVEHDRMPVISWGSPTDGRRLQELGYTHFLDWCYAHVFVRKKKNPEKLIEQLYRTLDDFLANGARVLDLIHGTFLHDKFPRVGRDGKPYKVSRQNFDASDPAGIQENSVLTENIINAFKSHPAYAGSCFNSEVRDQARPSFSRKQCADYKKKFGHDMPPEAEGRTAPHYTSQKNFPLSRIIEPDHPLLEYYTWYWKEGDGWNNLHSSMHDICKRLIKRPFLTFYDPAVRVPPIWGSGGRVDMLSHWTYAYPDPINVAVSTEETFAMAAGRPGQRLPI